MATYEVTTTVNATIYVEADSREEAEQQAWDDLLTNQTGFSVEITEIEDEIFDPADNGNQGS